VKAVNTNKQNVIEMNVYLGTDDTHRAAPEVEK